LDLEEPSPTNACGDPRVSGCGGSQVSAKSAVVSRLCPKNVKNFQYLVFFHKTAICQVKNEAIRLLKAGQAQHACGGFYFEKGRLWN